MNMLSGITARIAAGGAALIFTGGAAIGVALAMQSSGAGPQPLHLATRAAVQVTTTTTLPPASTTLPTLPPTTVASHSTPPVFIPAVVTPVPTTVVDTTPPPTVATTQDTTPMTTIPAVTTTTLAPEVQQQCDQITGTAALVTEIIAQHPDDPSIPTRLYMLRGAISSWTSLGCPGAPPALPTPPPGVTIP